MWDKEKQRVYMKRYNEVHREQMHDSNKAWREAHREQRCAQNKAWYEAHREQILARIIKRKYNLSQIEYDIHLLDQRNACAICRQPFTATPAVDHDHKTEKVRGLLCVSCNHGIGNFNDDPCRLRLAAEYLERRMN